MANSAYVLFIAIQLATFIGIIWGIIAIKRALRKPYLSEMPAKRVITTPSGQFTVDEGGKRNATVNDDNAVWRRENSQG